MQAILTYCIMAGVLGAALFLFGQSSLGSLGQATMSPVSARLVADTTAVEPGKAFKVGVLFTIDPGWHIYWKNPGEAGLATSVEFILPEGFSVGKLRWPEPQKFEQAGDIEGYGYSGSVMLFATITPPKDLKEGDDVPIKAQASWLSCEKICLLGKATVDLTLKVSAKAEPYNSDLFAEWTGRTDPVAPAFMLLDQDGKAVKLSDYAGKIVVLEWMNVDCPFVKHHYRPDVQTMIRLAEKYKDKGVVWLAINSTNYWTNHDGQIFHMEHQLPYPILDDHNGVVGRLYKAKSTPHMFVIDADGLIVYRGAIDNSPMGRTQLIVGPINYVEAALDELLAGKPVSIPQTKSYGCSVKYAPE